MATSMTIGTNPARLVVLERHSYRVRVYCGGLYIGSLFKAVDPASGKRRVAAGWADGEQSIPRLTFTTRKRAVEYLVDAAADRGRFN